MSETRVDTDLLALDLMADGVLEAPEVAELGQRDLSDPKLARELEENRRLVGLLAKARVPVREGFADEVMSSLEERPTSARTWLIAAAVVAVLGLAAVTLVSGSSWSTGLTGALVDFSATALSAGAGLMDASWKGVATLMASWFGGSPVRIAIAAAMVVAANLLLFRLVRRPARARRRG